MKKLIFTTALFAFALGYSQDSYDDSSKIEYTTTAKPTFETVERPTFGTDRMDFTNRLLQNMDFHNVVGDSQLSTKVFMTISKHGKVEKVATQGDNASLNEEVQRAVTNIAQGWKPAYKGGKPVKSIVSLDFSFRK